MLESIDWMIPQSWRCPRYPCLLYMSTFNQRYEHFVSNQITSDGIDGTNLQGIVKHHMQNMCGGLISSRYNIRMARRTYL